jgi:hypothetical protein
MSYNEEETRFLLIDPVLRDKGYNDHQWIEMETGSNRSARKAADIDDAVFGLKAVNPNAVVKADERSP